MKLELTEKQRKIVEATENKIVVIACAASGKTRVLTERIKYLLSMGVPAKKIVAITFTNAAGAEIRERANAPRDMFIGTIHSYANYLLKLSGNETSQILEEEKFDELFEKVKRHPECLQEVDHLLLDEAQDSNRQQFEFLELINPKNYMYVGDFRQSIYRWNGARPDKIMGLLVEEGVKTYNLNENFRNSKKILNYAKQIIRQNGYEFEDNSIPMQDTEGRVITVEYSPRHIVETIKAYGNYREWFILCRLNEEINIICRELARQEVPYDTFKKGSLDNKALQKKLEEDTVKVLTIHTSKGLENNNVVVIGARGSGKGIEENCVNYVAATRAKKLLVWTYYKKARGSRIKTTNWE